MNTMRATYSKPPETSPGIWLRTDNPVVPINPSTWEHLGQVETALHLGISATADAKRPGFYEIEVGDNWYYIHIPNRITGVYLVAAGKKRISDRPVIAHQCA
jgi:hypothetical protein